MYYPDCHMHSAVSPDSSAPRHVMAQAALEAGLREICFTDHFDLIDFDGNYSPDYDWTNARREHRRALEAWGDRIAIRYGVEVGNVPTDFAAADRGLSEPGLDFVLCSVHNLSLASDGVDFYAVSYDSPALCYAHLDEYFELMRQSVEWGGFDVLAHIPYPLRYMRERDGQRVGLARYEELLRHILRRAVETGKGIEVNTKGWSNATQADYIWLVQTYRALGGEIVTVGSDAHEPETVGRRIPETCRLLRELGLQYVAIYRARQPHFIPLED
ncbi:MAG: histidinol-phosphatase HisJ family protein [Oscillospiraceae bacterium]|nr:histidinol-phosphatase HisJ family protein [Oscillospiraceae bacterium]